jgi:hypothetical protein
MPVGTGLDLDTQSYLLSNSLFIKAEDRCLHSFYSGKGLFAQVCIHSQITSLTLEFPDVLF